MSCVNITNYTSNYRDTRGALYAVANTICSSLEKSKRFPEKLLFINIIHKSNNCECILAAWLVVQVAKASWNTRRS